MLKMLVYRILIFGSIIAFSNAAKCWRTPKTIVCENADTGVIERLDIYYKNDVNLIVKNSTIPVLGIQMFRELKFLERLSLTGCGIRIIQDGVFQGLNLTHLNLAGNSITDIPENVLTNLPGLKFLDLSRNIISQLKLNAGVNYLPQLRYVDVSDNRLKNFTLVGNFTQLETVNFENNKLTQFQTDSFIHLPKIKEVFFDGNSFNKSYESFLTFVLMSCKIKIDFENSFIDNEWKNDGENFIRKNSTDFIRIRNNSARSIVNEIEKEFKVSPELIKSLNPTELTNLVQRILSLRNFTINEKHTLEIDRKRVQDEFENVKKELTRIDQIRKRFEEISSEAKKESIGEYIEKSCQKIPDDTWWRRFKKWKCKKLFNWVKRLIINR